MFVFQRLARMFKGFNIFLDASVIASESDLLKHGFTVEDDGSYCLRGECPNDLIFQDLDEVSLVFKNCSIFRVRFSYSTVKLKFQFCILDTVEINNVASTEFYLIDCRYHDLKITDSMLFNPEWRRSLLDLVNEQS